MSITVSAGGVGAAGFFAAWPRRARGRDHRLGKRATTSRCSACASARTWTPSCTPGGGINRGPGRGRDAESLASGRARRDEASPDWFTLRRQGLRHPHPEPTAAGGRQRCPQSAALFFLFGPRGPVAARRAAAADVGRHGSRPTRARRREGRRVVTLPGVVGAHGTPRLPRRRSSRSGAERAGPRRTGSRPSRRPTWWFPPSNRWSASRTIRPCRHQDRESRTRPWSGSHPSSAARRSGDGRRRSGRERGGHIGRGGGEHTGGDESKGGIVRRPRDKRGWFGGSRRPGAGRGARCARGPLLMRDCPPPRRSPAQRSTSLELT